MKQMTVRTIVLFVYVLTLGVAFPAAPGRPCMLTKHGVGAGMAHADASECTRRACSAADAETPACGGGECGDASPVRSGCDERANDEFKAGCGCNIHSRHAAGGEYLGERTVRAERVNSASFAAADITGGNGFSPQSTPLTISYGSFPRNDLLHRCLILII
ncbi:MAG: hypothetical protein ACYC9O_16020 [Candidatus Latescibacterota bacterium]